jgi:uncharacterized protein (TIGR03435 family)
MQAMDDMALLREYAANNSETAFEELVSRRVNFVYSAALRQVRDPHLAGEITQAVFIILAQKAGRISDKTILTGWFFKTTRFAALAQMRADAKRRQRELEVQMQSEFQSPAADEIWNQMSPLLDEALATLGEKDRQAVLLRFFDNKSLAEVGSQLGTGEDTARKRVSRALEKLHRYFSKRGVTSTTATIAEKISTNSIQAAPVALAKSVAAVAIAKGAAASASTLTLIKGALKIMAWTKAKIAIVASVGVLLAAGTTTIVVEKISHDLSWANDPRNWAMKSEVLAKNPPAIILRTTRFQHITGGTTSENRIEFENVSLQFLFGLAYAYDQDRLVLPNDPPQGNFDFMFTLPSMPGDWQKALKAEIKKQFGLVAHLETREADVLIAKVTNSNAPGLKIASGSENHQTGNFRNVVFKGVQIDSLTSWLESVNEMPVLNETGLTNYYDIAVKWKPHTGQSEADAIRQILPDQFGLELVPSRDPIEMLVVEKVK